MSTPIATSQSGAAAATPRRKPFYASLCGRTLSRAHARAGDAVASRSPELVGLSVSGTSGSHPASSRSAICSWKLTRGDKRSHWVAKAPLETTVEWDAEIITEREGSLIGWRSLEGSEVDTAGSVHFTPAPAGRGTEVRVVLKYDPPAGKVGAAVARMFGAAPEQEIEEDLRRFKQIMEAGEAPTTLGQPACA